jgi:thiosulfate dehydrogenase
VKSFLFGIVATIVVLAAAAFVGLTQGLIVPANADARPSALEAWLAKKSLGATLRRDAPKTPNPVALTDTNLIAGIKLYAQNCVVCHGAADRRPSTIAVGLYQHAPILPKHGVEDDPDGVTYWKIAHGIRLTGMPSFGKTLSDEQLWELALFLKHMDKLPPAPEREWKAVKNPVSLASPSANGR